METRKSGPRGAAITKNRVVGIDLGGTRVRAALCDTSGHILKRTSQPALALQGPELVFTRIVQSVGAVVSDWTEIKAIGLSAPGPLDPWRGVVLESPNLPGMVDFPIKARLEAEFHVAAFAGNDANLAAVGEHRYGAGRGIPHMIYLTISTGIGGGIIADNRLFLGWRGLAGEVGHMTIDVHGPVCNCGNTGCLEALAAGPAIAASARTALAAGAQSSIRTLAGGDPNLVTMPMVVQSAREGDPVARDLLARAGVYIGIGLVNLLHIFDTELFVIGGGVAINAWDYLYPAMSETLQKRAFPSMTQGVRIVPAQLGDDAGLLGAAAIATDSGEQNE